MPPSELKREMQMQTTVRSTIHLLEWLALRRGCGELELSHIAGGDVKCLSHFGK